MNILLLLACLVVVALLAWAILVFNRLVRLRNQVRTAWADIDVQLQRRHDLVPLAVVVSGPGRQPLDGARVDTEGDASVVGEVDVAVIARGVPR